MNEKLKEFAAQAGFNLSGHWHCCDDQLERFAELVRQDEREACAKLCESKMIDEYATGKVDHNEQSWTEFCAAAIRARGEPSPAFKNYMDDNWAGIV